MGCAAATFSERICECVSVGSSRSNDLKLFAAVVEEGQFAQFGFFVVSAIWMLCDRERSFEGVALLCVTLGGILWSRGIFSFFLY
jgi:hypothetical protein